MQSSAMKGPGRAEKTAAAAAMAVLAAVVAGVMIQQARFSPAVQVAGALARGATGAASPGRSGDILDPWPAGLSPMGGREEFPAATLSDKIDGKAELYLSAGFVKLVSQRARIGADPGSWMEIFVYDMGSPANAFSVWSSQKRPEAAEVALADYGYRAGNEVCLVHGRFYVELVGTDAREATSQAAAALARAFVARTPVSEHAAASAEEAILPRDGMIPGTLALVPADVFGFDRLKSVFVARYRDGAAEVALFAARRQTAEEAARQASELRAFWIDECGGSEAAGAPAGAAVVDVGGGFEAVFSSGRFLIGVHQAGSLAEARRWVAVLRARTAEAKP